MQNAHRATKLISVFLNFKLFYGSVLLFVFTGCFYPHAEMLKTDTHSGEQKIIIRYKTPKTFEYEIAKQEKNWAILFSINDSTSISFPPPGAEIDNRYFYYFTVLDQNLNPLNPKPVLIEEMKKSKRSYPGQTFAVFSSATGYILVWHNHQDFYYQNLDSKGNPKEEKKSFYSSPKESIDKKNILGIQFRHRKILLFIQEKPASIYETANKINVIAHSPENGETTTYENIAPDLQGMDFVKSFEVIDDQDDLLLSWIEGVKRDVLNGTFKLGSEAYLLKCNSKNMKCDKIVKTFQSVEYSKTELRLIQNDSGRYLVIFDGKEYHSFSIHLNTTNDSERLQKIGIGSLQFENHFKYKNGHPIKVEIIQ